MLTCALRIFDCSLCMPTCVFSFSECSTALYICPLVHSVFQNVQLFFIYSYLHIRAHNIQLLFIYAHLHIQRLRMLNCSLYVTELTREGFEPWTLGSQTRPLNWLDQREFPSGQAFNWPGDSCSSSTYFVLPPSGHQVYYIYTPTCVFSISECSTVPTYILHNCIQGSVSECSIPLKICPSVRVQCLRMFTLTSHNGIF